MEQRRQRLSTQERQAEIVEATLDLVAEKGVEAVTTQDIAQAIGVTQGALFRHFPSKDAIWVAVVHFARARLAAAVEASASQAADPLDALERVFLAHLGLVSRFPAIPRVLLSDALLRRQPRLRQLLQETLAGYETMLAGLITRAKAAKLVQEDMSEAAAATLFTALIQGLVARVLVVRTGGSVTAEGKRLFPLYLRAIGARPRANR